MILLFVHLISLCCPVLSQACPIDSLNSTSFTLRYVGSDYCMVIVQDVYMRNDYGRW